MFKRHKIDLNDDFSKDSMGTFEEKGCGDKKTKKNIRNNKKSKKLNQS